MHQKCDGPDKIKAIYCIWPVFHGREGEKGGYFPWLGRFHTSQEMSIYFLSPVCVRNLLIAVLFFNGTDAMKQVK